LPALGPVVQGSEEEDGRQAGESASDKENAVAVDEAVRGASKRKPSTGSMEKPSERELQYAVRRRSMAHRFTVIFEKEEEGGYHVFCPTLPGCHTQSETIEEGIENIREAIGLYIESLTEDGLPIPTEDILIKPIEIPA